MAITFDTVPFNPKQKKFSEYPPMIITEDGEYTAHMKTTEGDITLALFAKTAPKTVNSFVFLAKSGFYNDVIFHRVIQNFVIQGGDPSGNGTGSAGYKFEDEFAKDAPRMTEGAIAMANAGSGTNGSQFFICLTDLPHLENKHTVFGKVTEGMDVVKQIVSVPVDFMDKPKKPVTIKSIEIDVKNNKA